MNTRLRRGERVLFESRANMQRGIETAGGYLYLTTRRLVFEAHAFNIQSGSTVVWLEDVEKTAKCWTKFLGLIPVFPNSLAVVTADKTYRFVVPGREEWMREIRYAKEDLPDDEEDDAR